MRATRRRGGLRGGPGRCRFCRTQRRFLGKGEVEGGEEAQEGGEADGDGKGTAEGREQEEHHEVALVALPHAVADLRQEQHTAAT